MLPHDLTFRVVYWFLMVGLPLGTLALVVNEIREILDWMRGD
jgi:hypothetical protein